VLRFIAFAVLSLTVACGGDENYVCTLLGCDNGADFRLASVPESGLVGANVAVCFRDACSGWVINELPTDVTYVRLEPPGDPRIDITISPRGSDAFEIDISVASDRYELFEDGDVYTATITAANGTTLLERAWSVDYRTWQPNGADCEPTCRSSITTTEL